jgi:hypothetical protein
VTEQKHTTYQAGDVVYTADGTRQRAWRGGDLTEINPYTLAAFDDPGDTDIDDGWR